MTDLIEKFYKDEHVEYQLSEKKWKLKIEMKHGGPAYQIKSACYLYKVNKDIICVDFQRIEGDSLNFFKQYQKIAEDLRHHNDAVYTTE